jgi:hypothetical protein
MDIRTDAAGGRRISVCNQGEKGGVEEGAVSLLPGAQRTIARWKGIGRWLCAGAGSAGRGWVITGSDEGMGSEEVNTRQHREQRDIRTDVCRRGTA